MAGFDLIHKGFKKIYSGEHAALTHISVFAICGIMSVISTIFQVAGKTKVTPDLGVSLTGALILFVLSIYLYGYTYKFIHKCFNEDEQGLPDINFEPFGIFFKALPLLIIWGIYFLVFILLGVFVHVLIIPIIALLAVITPFVAFVLVAFSKNYDTNGLFDITLPFKFFTPALSSIVIQGLCFIPLWLIIFIPTIITAGILGLTVTMEKAIYIINILVTYISFIVQMIWNYSLVQIYKEKLENITNK